MLLANIADHKKSSLSPLGCSNRWDAGMLGCLNPPGEPSFNEILINTVREYPALYTNHRRPYDNIDRGAIWEEVANKIGRNVNAEFAKKRWLQLRDRYRKELKIAIAQNFTQPQKWNHFSLLKWLDPHLQGAVPMNGGEGSQEANGYTISSSRLGTDSSSSVLDLTSLGIGSYTQPEDHVDGDSDVLEDVKPTMSALQSVLAATEAQAAAAAAAAAAVATNAAAHQSDDLFAVESEEPRCLSSSEVLDQMISSSESSQTGDAGGSSKAALDALAECVQSVQSVQSVQDVQGVQNVQCVQDVQTVQCAQGVQNIQGVQRVHPSRRPSCLPAVIIKDAVDREAGLLALALPKPEVDSELCRAQHTAMDIRRHTLAPVATASVRAFPYRSSPYVKPSRPRCRQFTTKFERTDSPSTPMLSSASSSGARFAVQTTASGGVNDDHWFNDEQMLFARIIGLRLKKMPAATRKLVRAKIMEILDEEEVKQEEEAMESGASVAE